MTGLNSNIILTNGRFTLSKGPDRARDALWFYSIFDRMRVYYSDYGASFVSLLQKPSSVLVANRTILLGILRSGIIKYVPNVTIKNIDMGYLYNNRKQLNLLLEYDVVGEKTTTESEVIFI